MYKTFVVVAKKINTKRKLNKFFFVFLDLSKKNSSKKNIIAKNNKI